MKQKIIDTFKLLGFELNELEDFGYEFEYEGVTYIWLLNEDDHFLNLSIPGIQEKGDTDELTFYKLIDKLNSTIKYIKVNTLHDSIWLFYERELTDDEDLEQTISNMIINLDGSLMMYRQIIKAADEDINNAECIEEDEVDEENNDADNTNNEKEE